ncbi:MAG: hypothetical protein JXM70_31030 [Pirellulales bacterium]|nr:hypothetical protein [Pirellulales bacterium]
MKNHTTLRFTSLLIAALALLCCFAPAHAEDTLSQEKFENPPLEARPTAWWEWLNGNADAKTITTDLEEAKAKGMGGLEIFDTQALFDPQKIIPAGPAFLSDESVRSIRHAIKESKRLGMNVGLVACSGYNAGGAWVTPDWAQKQLYSSSHDVKGPLVFEGSLPFPKVPDLCPKNAEGLPQFYREVAVLAVPKNDKKTIAGLSAVVNLSKQFKDGKLSWSVPDGEWVILRFVCSNTGKRLMIPGPKSDGLEIDFLDPAATRRHFKYILDRLGITPENAAEVGLNQLSLDSMEQPGGIPWTDRFPEYFKKWSGYNPILYLPILAGWRIKGVTDAFLYDYRKALSEQVIFSHYASARDFLKPYGIQLVAEAGGPGPPIWDASLPVDSLKALGNASVPRGEFWNRHRNMFLVKEVSSAAHIYGIKYISAESFTTWRRWKDGPFVMKLLADRALCEGLNQFTFDTFSHSPVKEGFPGWVFHAGSDLNPRATWWEQSRPFIDYLSRCCYLLQQGQFVADVCGYYGDQAPNFWPPLHDVPQKPLYPGLDAGYDYDVVNTDVILNRMEVRDGRVTLPDGMSYRLLVLPSQDHMPVEVLEKVAKLVKAGAIIVGPKPSRDPRLADQVRRTTRVLQLADELWGSDITETSKGRSVGQGKVFADVTPTLVLATLGVAPDFVCEHKPAGPEVDFIHRRTKDADLYFVRNKGTNGGLAHCRFRVQGRKPELWDPATGRTDLRVSYTEETDGISLDLPLAPGGSMFVVFRSSTSADAPNYPMAQPDLEKPVDGPWTVHFAKGWGAPEEMQFEKLQSWTDFTDEGIKYFSGTAAYSTTLDIPAGKLGPGRRVYLDLGKLCEVGEVFLNGRSLGIVWKPPFRVDLTPAVHAGKNELAVKVTNLWINRLTGDMVTKGKHYTRTNHNVPVNYGGDVIWREQTSGLLGPVKLLYVPAN